MDRTEDLGARVGTGGVAAADAPGPYGTEESASVVRSEERLRVGHTLVAAERVLVRRRVVTETRMVEVQVRREELVVERVPVGPGDRAAGAGALGTGGPGTPGELVLELREEVPVLTTVVRPVERVRVRVERVAGTQQVTAELRHEEVVVDDTRRG